MLKLVNITKDYIAADSTVRALDSVSVEFRRNEFVSILGQSGCGKTTLLNIIGGLDRYTSGDLVIEGRSTEVYSDRDWDTYRNHSIGFVFQSYNLIPHQTILSNVILALTLSGVSKAERRKRAIEALEKVGLGDQLNKKPNQLSGGQMQRVAIARALINDPEILLADEPTGALDSETSEQIMHLLKEVADDRLVIMVTHNPELAERYSTRIIRLHDGKITDDSSPFDSSKEPESAVPKKASASKGKKKVTSMSFFTAMSLSLNNLMIKKGRTFLTSFAGSIGIIGIALILSVSSGFQSYIDKVQQDTISSYPIRLDAESVDMSELFKSLMNDTSKNPEHGNDKVYTNTDMYEMMSTYMHPESTTNNLKKFKAWMDGNSEFDKYITALKYGYTANLDVYLSDYSNGAMPANDFMALFADMYSSSSEQMMSSMNMAQQIKVFDELPAGLDDQPINDLIYSQYELAGDGMRWPEKDNEVVIVLGENNEISETFLYCIGLLDRSKIMDIMSKMMSGEGDSVFENETLEWNYSDIIGKKFKLILPTDRYSGKDYDGDGKNDIWTDISENDSDMKIKLAAAEELEVVGIIRPKADTVRASMNCAVAYLSSLSDRYTASIAESEIVKYQLAHQDTDVFTGLPFDTIGQTVTDSQKAESFTSWAATLDSDKKAEIYEQLAATPDDEIVELMLSESLKQYPDRASKEVLLTSVYIENSDMNAESVKKFVADMSDADVDKMVTEIIKTSIVKKLSADSAEKLAAMTAEQKSAMFDGALTSLDEKGLALLYDSTYDMRFSSSSFAANCKLLGYSTPDDPQSIVIYAATFKDKESIADLISQYNSTAAKEDQISYTDYVALIMSSVSTIINIISYVLIAFVSISLVVSSIMIGVITYISVLERTKEIGILRSIGASKRDITRVFNAETVIVGLVAGIIGILVTMLLNIPINLIISSLSDINGIARLPFLGAVILVTISMLLTLVAGLIPSLAAAKKDPVVALRVE